MRPLPFIRWFFLFSLSVLCGCLSYRDLVPGKTELGRRTLTVPAILVGSHLVVEGRWDRHGPWRYLVDTGSSVTLVSPEYAERYATSKAALAPPSVRVRASSGDSTLLPQATVRRIGVGEAYFDNADVLVKDLSDISAHLGVKIDGILGFPLFRNAILTLDYPQSRIVLTPPHLAQPVPGTTIKFNDARRIPLIPITVGGTTTLALIDSGSDAPLILNPYGMDLPYAVEPRSGNPVGTLAGDRVPEIGRLAVPLRIGAYAFPQPIVDLTTELTAVGGDILRYFTVTFDQTRNQVTFSRPDMEPIQMGPVRSAGMAFEKGATYWRVVAVVPGSPAAQAGVQPGDLVTRINGESIAQWPLQRLEPFLRRSPEVVFTFIDGARERPIVIPTFELVP